MRKFIATVVFLLLVLKIASAATTIRSGNCIGGEACLFSLWNKTDTQSHTGECGYFGESVCTNEVQSAVIRVSCSSGESPIASFLPVAGGQGINNSHIGSSSSHDYKLCTTPENYACAIKNSCTASQTCMGSISGYSDAHFGECNLYSKQVCCVNDISFPVITNQSINTTAISSNGAVRFTANVTDDAAISTVIATVQFPNSTLKNFTLSLLSGDLYFLDFTNTEKNGVYTWTKTYANDSLNNFTIATPNLEFRVRGVVYEIRGTAMDFLTGVLIESGNATAIIKETGDRGTSTISNGKYSINLTTNLLHNETRFTMGLIFNDSKKVGYVQLIFGLGQFTKQIQQCSSNVWRFTGWAVDSEGMRISSGNISISVNNGTLNRNTTTFSNGVWNISLTPCLVSGDIYTFEFLMTDSTGKRAQFYQRHVAK